MKSNSIAESEENENAEIENECEVKKYFVSFGRVDGREPYYGHSSSQTGTSDATGPCKIGMESANNTVPSTPPPASSQVAPLDDSKLKEAMNALEKFHIDNQHSPRTNYNKLRSEREKATFTLMMKLAPDLLTSIRKEFFAREDSLQLNDFLYIIQLHLLKDMPEKEKVEFMVYSFTYFLIHSFIIHTIGLYIW